MNPNDALQSECLSLVAGLYGAVPDPARFAERRASCEQWLARQVSADTQAAAFLRTQIGRATEALTLSARTSSHVPSACAVLTIDDQGRVIAAGAEAWTLLASGSPTEDPLRLPRALRGFVADTRFTRVVPRALRVPLDDGTSELAGIVLGVDRVRHVVGAMTLITLLLCDVGVAEPAESPATGRGEVWPFRRRSRLAGAPASVDLSVERPA